MINKIFNEGFALLSVALGVVLTLKYFSRIMMKRSTQHKKFFIELNKYLRNSHIYLGIIIIIIGMIHGIYSSDDLISINLGTICWILTIFLAFSYMIRHIMKKKNSWMKYHRILVFLFLTSLVLHLFDIKIYRNLVHENYKDNKGINIPINEISGDLRNYKFKDGVYEGVANGYGPGLTVRIEIENNEISIIKIINHNEVGESHYGRAMEIVSREIINTQSLDVDIISGATYTSEGIINAIKDALIQARIES